MAGLDVDDDEEEVCHCPELHPNDKDKTHNFSWFEKDVFAAMGYPEKSGGMKYLTDKGIKLIINLERDPPRYKLEADKAEITIYNIIIGDFKPPTPEQMHEANLVIEKNIKRNRPVGIHCWAGCGRTGTMLAAYLLYKNKNMTVDEAVKETKKRRSPIYAIENDRQIEALEKYKNEML